MKNAVLTGVLLLVVTVGCVQKEKRLSSADREAATQIASRTPPKPSHALDIRFEDKVRLLGYDVSSERLKPGQTFTVTWYWQVEKPLGQGWQLFTHLGDGTKGSRMNVDSVRPLRTLYPEATWKKGDYIKDIQEITFAGDWNTNKATFFLGFWNGPHRLHVTVGAQDGLNRALALTLPVDGASPAQPNTALPRMIARHTTAALTLDGKLDDADWKMAQPSGPLVQTMTGAAGSFVASARVVYDADNLYVGYDVADDYLKCTFKKNDDHLWEQDVVEVMVDPDGDGKNYFELQASPTGLTFDTRYDARRMPQPFGDMAWTSGVVAKVALRGKVNDDDSDEGYSIELAIPWRAFAAGKTPAAPPAAGDTWRMNFFVMDAREKGQRAVGWSPPLIGDFHTLDRFGRVVFPQAAK